jgi:hypothetical protein
MYPDKFVKHVEDIPQDEHYACYSQGYEHIPGDERSRTHPGHGYPASTTYFVNYMAFLTLEKLQAYLEFNAKRQTPEKLVVAKITPLKVEQKISVSIS